MLDKSSALLLSVAGLLVLLATSSLHPPDLRRDALPPANDSHALASAPDAMPYGWRYPFAFPRSVDPGEADTPGALLRR